MKFYTKNYLENLAESSRQKVKTFSQVIKDSHQQSNFDIFLSHSFLDKKLIEGLYEELTSKGHSVYVDWITDDDLDRKEVTEVTVERIRKRMKQCKSLIYGISENASVSKWMPWELGYMDGVTNRCSILPITNYETSTFERQEFLSVYPVIATEEIESFYQQKKILNVYKNNNTKVYASLNEWKEGTQPYYHH